MVLHWADAQGQATAAVTLEWRLPIPVTTQLSRSSGMAVVDLADHLLAGIEWPPGCRVSTAMQSATIVQAQLRLHQQAVCPGLANLSIARIGTLDAAHVVTLHHYRAGMLHRQQLLQYPDWSYQTPAVQRTETDRGVVRQYVNLGVHHILGGLDHLLFLVALVLVQRLRYQAAIKRMALLVTGFTLGHSLTLAASVLGWVTFDTRLVEAAIGWTIFLLALEIVLQPQRKVGIWFAASAVTGLGLVFAGQSVLLMVLGMWAVLSGFLLLSDRAAHPGVSVHFCLVMLFGLIHGLGFAASLDAVGLPGHALLPALFGFNLGVEVGQLLFVGVFFTLVCYLQRMPSQSNRQIAGVLGQRSMYAALLVTGLTGIYWYTSRLYQ